MLRFCYLPDIVSVWYSFHASGQMDICGGTLSTKGVITQQIEKGPTIDTSSKVQATNRHLATYSGLTKEKYTNLPRHRILLSKMTAQGGCTTVELVSGVVGNRNPIAI